ncbi:MAG: hypothetical protein AVDCRST_MAG50-1794, partial [uncultured Acidimicrobiales bacterium]
GLRRGRGGCRRRPAVHPHRPRHAGRGAALGGAPRQRL